MYIYTHTHNRFIYIINRFEQVLKTATFRRTETRDTFTIFYQVTCHRKYVIYLLEYVMCKISMLESLKYHLISD